MVQICPKCGLPKDLCVCQEIVKEAQKIVIKEEKKKFKKFVTVIEGLDSSTDVKSLAKELKRRLACGGTVKGNTIELQGEHKEKAKDILLSMNYTTDQIDVV
jgi:translation initiation factor 1